MLNILKENTETKDLIAEYNGPKNHKPFEPKSFEKSKPRQMYQMDITNWHLKSLYNIYIIGCIDDYSRYIVSWELFRRQTSEHCIDVLRNTIEQHTSTPEEVLRPAILLLAVPERFPELPVKDRHKTPPFLPFWACFSHCNGRCSLYPSTEDTIHIHTGYHTHSQRIPYPPPARKSSKATASRRDRKHKGNLSLLMYSLCLGAFVAIYFLDIIRNNTIYYPYA